MAVTNFYKREDAPLDALEGKKIAVIGYGNQGHAHSLNLRDKGIEVAVAELEGSDNYMLAIEHGFSPIDIKRACEEATLIIVTIPDEIQASVYADYIAPNLEMLNLKMAVVEHLEQPPHVVLYGLLYGIGYTIIILLLTIVIFSKRDLK